MPLSCEFNTLLKLLSNSLFSTNYTFDENIDWNKVMDESIHQSVTALAFDATKGIDIPNEISQKWLMYAVKSISNNYTVTKYHGILHKMMSENNIPYCVLKGSASAYYYPNPTLRCMGDVDFLVPHNYYKKAIETFLNDGFITRGERDDVHTVFRKGDMHFEMHFEPPGIPANEPRVIIENYFKSMFEESTVAELEGNSFINPSKFHHGLILLLHTCHHLLREGIGLRHLCDWAVFVNSFKDDEFVTLFKEKLEKIGMWNFACVLTITANKYLGMPLPSSIVTDFSKFNGLIDDIFVSGNFGKKAENRYFESLYIKSKNTLGKTENRSKQFISSINNIIYSKHRSVKKLKILLPFFWLFYGSRYFVRYAFGKRKAILNKEIIDSAGKRKSIYDDFHLFETEK